MLRPLLAILLPLLLAVCNGRATSPEYSEQLTLRPLPASSLLASFAFISNTSQAAFDAQNFRYFPRSLGQILQHTRTKELHLRFSSGRWDDERWGERPSNGYKEGGTGVELWAWIDAATGEEANACWLSLTNALSGLFCASLNFIDATRTICPVLAFDKQGYHSATSSRSLHLLHGTLPAETVCTENLTPFLKALPCKGRAGISSLLDGHKLFDSTWQTMSIDVQPRCPSDAASCVVEIEQNIDMVLDLDRSRRPRDDPIPRPPDVRQMSCDESKYYHHYGDSCYPLQGPSSPAFSISEVFGRPIQGACPLAEEASFTEPLCIEGPAERSLQVNTTANFSERKDEYRTFYTLPIDVAFDVKFAEQQDVPVLGEQSLITVFRTLTGKGQQHGGFRTIFTNPSPEGPVKIVFLEPVPWYMKPYLHTMVASLTPLEGSSSLSPVPEAMEHIYYRPSVDRQRGSHLELVLNIPAASKLTLAYDFEKSILRYTEYPPDANRGFNAASAIVRVLSGPNGPPSHPTYVRTTSLLLYLPTPGEYSKSDIRSLRFVRFVLTANRLFHAL